MPYSTINDTLTNDIVSFEQLGPEYLGWTWWNNESKHWQHWWVDCLWVYAGKMILNGDKIVSFNPSLPVT